MLEFYGNFLFYGSRAVLKARLQLLDVRDHRFNTPLLLAIKRGHIRVAHILVSFITGLYGL
jgi:hypothetical protein